MMRAGGPHGWTLLRSSALPLTPGLPVVGVVVEKVLGKSLSAPRAGGGAGRALRSVWSGARGHGCGPEDRCEEVTFRARGDLSRPVTRRQEQACLQDQAPVGRAPASLGPSPPPVWLWGHLEPDQGSPLPGSGAPNNTSSCSAQDHDFLVNGDERNVHLVTNLLLL